MKENEQTKACAEKSSCDFETEISARISRELIDTKLAQPNSACVSEDRRPKADKGV